ncbi:MAG: nuclear transport factor 2 family protein [Synergistaceae bacterium]|nr:nuclear transport factor 2 family protein [Synergistaceae bacterium]MBQ3398175.1 nuclear transport factor 2 family protein [Synergistaceae bacterium]MBQ6419392.1 nuclear transport factor 2 family protein [Synergistaceae bacterium]MBQ6666020.1 nuclear transport factor 2 family protein [Synergistaceae bacterium]MBQ6981249.1 nuclear transport factor 2 family protein [Synergistaceae bacterium]
MNNFLILGAIISVFMFPLQSLAGEREELQEIYSDMYRYMIAKDVSQLGNLLDDSFILVHMTGMKQTKKEYLTSIQNGTLNYFSEELEYFDAQISDNSAVIGGQSRVNAAVFGGGRHTWRLELNIKLNKKNGQWLMTEARASTY